LEEAGCVRGRFVELVHVKSTATPVNSQLLELGHQVRDRDANWTNNKQLELKKKTKTNQTDTLRKKTVINKDVNPTKIGSHLTQDQE